MTRNDGTFDLICACCGFNMSKTHYNPRKRLTELKLQRSNTLNRLITEVSKKIRHNVPSEDSVTNEYYFMRGIRDIPENVIRVGIHKYLERSYYAEQKGFRYLSRIIQYTNDNSDAIKRNEKKRLGTIPKPQRKEDIDE
jgi:hypothetical protein|tara:strand:- start:1128 stop:1544 length:417 start_codon:yes stop_codon:yes gene_type:complete